MVLPLSAEALILSCAARREKSNCLKLREKAIKCLSHVSQNQRCTEQVHSQPPSKVAEGADQEFLQNLSETDNALAANGKNWRSVTQALDSFDMF